MPLPSDQQVAAPTSRPNFRFDTPRTPRVLLAEDDPDLRALIAAALRCDGYDVIAVEDGGRMLVSIASAYREPAARDAFDVVVSDVRMPVCTGLQILEAMRRAHWRTPVILMTAFRDDDLRRRALESGAILFDKPFDTDDLRTAVLNLLPGARRAWGQTRR